MCQLRSRRRRGKVVGDFDAKAASLNRDFAALLLDVKQTRNDLCRHNALTRQYVTRVRCLYNMLEQ